MKLLIIVEDWISFYMQAEALVKGLVAEGAFCHISKIKELKADKKIFKQEKWDAVIGVGSWYGWEYLVKLPMEHGLKVFPWLVSNGGVKKLEVVELLNRLPRWFTPSEYCKQKFIQSGLIAEYINIIPEAVDNQLWRPLPKDSIDKYSDLLGINHSVPILLTMGGDATSKGAQEVLYALGRLPKDLPWLYIIKTWPQPLTFKRGLEEFKIISNLDIQDKIKYYTGEFSKDFVVGLMNMCDIYVAPSRGEGFGLPFVQAGMCEKPVISVDALSIKEIIVGGNSGLLVKTRKVKGEVTADIEDLASKLKLLIKNKKLREEMGKYAKIHCEKVFSPQIVAKQFLSQI